MYEDPEVQAQLARLYARILAWPEPPAHEDYELTLTRAEYKLLARFLKQTVGVELVEVETDIHVKSPG